MIIKKIEPNNKKFKNCQYKKYILFFKKNENYQNTFT